MYTIYIIVGVIMFLVGIVCGAVTGAIIRHINKKSAVKTPQEYTQYDREKLMADQETLLKGREDFSSQQYK